MKQQQQAAQKSRSGSRGRVNLLPEEPAKKTRKPKDSTPPIVDPLAPVASPPPSTPLPLADIPILALEDRQPADSTPPWEGTQQWTEPELVTESSDAPLRKTAQNGQAPRKSRTHFQAAA